MRFQASIKPLIFSILVISSACKTSQNRGASQTLDASSARPDEVFKYSTDISQSKNMTYLKYMKTVVKPGLDDVANNGYTIAGADTMQAAYDASGKKIKKNIDAVPGGIETVKTIAAALEGKKTNRTKLPNMIKSVNSSVNAFDLANFIGLASGGGVKIKYFEGNYALNIHYAVSDKQSGRSFGIGPAGGYNDISDVDYLKALWAYSKGSQDNLGAFYQTIFETLLDNDTSGYANVTPEGQSLLSNFFAVYTAEQDRNLMDGHTTPYWDAALLEVTLLAGFHAGQDHIKLVYWNAGNNRSTFTDKSFKQVACRAPSSSKPAELTDYWQFSRNINDSNNCKRSGINITNREFRQLERYVTNYMHARHPDLVKNINAALGQDTQNNVFYGLSNYLLSDHAADSHSKDEIKTITTAYIALLAAVNQEAQNITDWIDHGADANVVPAPVMTPTSAESTSTESAVEPGSQDETVQ